MAEAAEPKLKADESGKLQDKAASLDGCMKGKSARYAFTGDERILHPLRNSLEVFPQSLKPKIIQGHRNHNTASGLGHSNLKTMSDYLEELTSYENAYASQLEDEFGI